MERVLKVDKERCKADGICVRDCPGKILVQDEDGFPMAIEGAGELCIDCGHCVAVCPEGALDQRSMTAGECVRIERDLLISGEQMAQFLGSRRSIRQYKDRPVPRAKILALLEMAGHGPSGHNAQPSRWLVIMDRNEVHGMAGLVAEWMTGVIEKEPSLARAMHLDRVVSAWGEGVDRILRSAPHLIVGYATEEERTAPAAIITAIGYLELAAAALGLGTCWAGYFTGACQTYDPLKRALKLPKGHAGYGAVMIGYPRVKYHRIPPKRPVDVIWR